MSVRGCLRLPLWLLVLFAAARADAAADARQLQLLANSCMQCHAHQETGAPRIGNRSDWRDAVARGEDAMLVNVVQGVRGMPPLGYCSACSEDDFRVLIRLLVGDSRGDSETGTAQ
jgi:cytochrome c5